MHYLVYIERAAENLQFFLWYRDYSRRFFLLPHCQQELSPVWTETLQTETDARGGQRATLLQTVSPEVVDIIEESQLASKLQNPKIGWSPFSTPTRSIQGDHDGETLKSGQSDSVKSPATVRSTTMGEAAAAAFERAEHLQPCI
jgi:hypothetical protein